MANQNNFVVKNGMTLPRDPLSAMEAATKQYVDSKMISKEAIGAASSGANSDITSLSGLTTALSLAQGGTGAKTSADARSNLGLGSLSTQNSGAVALTGGAINGVTIGATAAAPGYFTTLNVSGGIVGNVTGNVTGSAGTAGTATKLATARTINGLAFDGTGNIAIRGNELVTSRGEPASHVGFAKELSWKHYGAGHTIFDASAGTLPSGTATGKRDAQVPWIESYPTLMGTNGENTFGVRVDSARLADRATQLDGAAYTTANNGWFYSTGPAGWFNATYNAGIHSTDAGIVRTSHSARFISTGTSPQAPAYSFGNDTDTGLYCQTDGVLNFAVNGMYAGDFNAAGHLSVRGAFYGGGAGLTGYAPNLTVANTSSISGALSESHAWTGHNQFSVNQGSGSSGTAQNVGWRFQCFSDDLGPAMMSFHRAGSYAVNFGLDKDNTLKIGGWSAAPDLFWFDMGGTFTAKANIVAYSDVRLKADWLDLPSDFVEQWAKVKRGTYRRMDLDGTKRFGGVSAQDVKAIVPEFTGSGANGYITLDNGAAAIVATTELAVQVVFLKEENACLKKKIEIFKQQMADIASRLTAMEK